MIVGAGHARDLRPCHERDRGHGPLVQLWIAGMARSYSFGSRAWPARTALDRGHGPLLHGMRAALAVYPLGLAAFVVFLFPDRQAHFGLVDDVTAGVECLTTMRRGYPDHHGYLR